MHDNDPRDAVVLSEQAAQILDQDPNFKVLRRIPNPCSRSYDHVANDCKVIAIVDVETSGLDPAVDQIIEFASMLAFVDHDGEIRGWMAPHAWLQEADKPLTEEVQKLTGLTDAMLKGHRIDDEFAVGLLERADLIIAHNAAFDASFIERRYPQIAGKAWGCSLTEIDWKGLGFEGRGLQGLLMQSGWFSAAHRAAADVWAAFWLVTLPADPDGLTHLQRLLHRAAKPTVRIAAAGAPFAVKDQLKSAGYRWDADARQWVIEVAEDEVAVQQAWLRDFGVHAPKLRTMKATERHRALKPDFAQLAENRRRFDALDEEAPW
jgi:DNA polymerase III subunit epsilon